MTSEHPALKALTAVFLAAALTAAACAAPAASAPRPAGEAQRRKGSDEKNPQYQYEKGVVALRYGLTDEAIRYGQLAVSLDPKHFDGWNLLGTAYYNKGEYAQAVEAYEKAAAIRPDSADAWKGLGLAYAELKEMDKAETALKKAYETDGSAETAYQLGKLCYNAKRFDEALDYAVKSIQKDGKNAGAYNLKGVALNQLKRFAEAAGSFQAGLVLAPGDVNLQVNLGIALVNGGQPAKALGVFEGVLPKIEQDSLRKTVEAYIKAIKDAGK